MRRLYNILTIHAIVFLNFFLDFFNCFLIHDNLALTFCEIRNFDEKEVEFPSLYALPHAKK